MEIISGSLKQHTVYTSLYYSEFKVPYKTSIEHAYYFCLGEKIIFHFALQNKALLPALAFFSKEENIIHQ